MDGQPVYRPGDSVIGRKLPGRKIDFALETGDIASQHATGIVVLVASRYQAEFQGVVGRIVVQYTRWLPQSRAGATKGISRAAGLTHPTDGYASLNSQSAVRGGHRSPAPAFHKIRRTGRNTLRNVCGCPSPDTFRGHVRVGYVAQNRRSAGTHERVGGIAAIFHHHKQMLLTRGRRREHCVLGDVVGVPSRPELLAPHVAVFGNEGPLQYC